MNEREAEITFVIDTIQKLCEKHEISLLPYTHQDGTQLIVVEDAQNGKRYALMINK